MYHGRVVVGYIYQILQSTREQVLDVPVPRMMEQLGKVPKMVKTGRADRRHVSPQGFLSGQGSTAFCLAEHRKFRGGVRFTNYGVKCRGSENCRSGANFSANLNKAGLSKCPRSEAKTQYRSVQWSRLSTSRVSRLNERNNDLLMMHLNFQNKCQVSRWEG